MSVSTMDTITRQLEERWIKMRSHKRAVASLRFQVEWEDENKPRRANGITVDVSHSGCMAVVGAHLPLRQRVDILNPASGRRASAQVVWRDHEAWDVGLELEKPDPSFWGL